VTEDTFRIVVAAAVALACIAFVVQAAAMFALYRVARRMQQKVGPLADRAEPVIGKLGPMIDQIGTGGREGWAGARRNRSRSRQTGAGGR